MPTKDTLTDRQLMLLSSASQRENGLLVLPDNLKGGAAQKVRTKLLAGGLVEEIGVAAAEPYWRVDDAGQLIGLRITRAGLSAIGIEEESVAAIADHGDGGGSCDFDGEGVADATGDPDVPTPGLALAPAGAARGDEAASAPREGTKQALVLSLLSRPDGATLDDLLSATGWLPHTTRAALTGLRQRGYAIDRMKEAGEDSVYRIVAPPASSGGSGEPVGS